MTPTRSIRVLQVVDALSVGGAETWLMELLRFWSRAGEGAPAFDILATSGRADRFDAEAVRLGARIFYVEYGRGRLASFTREFRRILAEGRYDAIHDHADYASGWHFLLGAGKLPPVRVAHVHNPWLHIEANYAISPRRRLMAALGKRLVETLATNVCGTSETILRRYGFELGTSAGPEVSVVHCGFDVRKFNGPRGSDRDSVLREFGWDDDAKIVLFAGRLDRALNNDDPKNHKNSWFALQVFRKAVELDPSLRLIMAGDGGPQRVALQQRIEDWGLQEKIRLPGVRDDIPRLMRAADVLFFPSRQEGLGMVAVEAQAAGLPVLASTAVPRECIVVPALYQSLDLGEPEDVWARSLVRSASERGASMETALRLTQASEFSVEASAARLERIYSGATS